MRSLTATDAQSQVVVEPRPAPGPGERYPDRTTLTGTAHPLLLFGAPDDAGVERLRRCWPGLVDVVQAAGAPPSAGLGSPGRYWCGPTGTSAFAPRRPTRPDWPRSTPTSTPTSSRPEPESK
jgi:hypothetical protein